MGAAISPYAPCKYCGQLTDFPDDDCQCDSMTVIVRSLVPKYIKLRVPRDATVLHLKECIQQSEGLPADQQLLIWKDTSLASADGLKLRDLGIRHETTQPRCCGASALQLRLVLVKYVHTRDP